MFPKEIFTQLVSELGVYNLKITSFAYILSYSILTGVDLDPEDSEIRIQYGSGSTTLLETSVVHPKTLNLDPEIFFTKLPVYFLRSKCRLKKFLVS